MGLQHYHLGKLLGVEKMVPVESRKVILVSARNYPALLWLNQWEELFWQYRPLLGQDFLMPRR